MYYLYNPTTEKLTDPYTGVSIEPGEVKEFSKTEEGAFMRFAAVFNGVVRIVDKDFYLNHLKSFSETSSFLSAEEMKTTENVGTNTVKKGRPKKQPQES